ncbi:MAG: ketopantoate reductase [Deltaproteobacteria bacterium]|nr:MAG: ketopantoate reductase [Deltaproteobacteria bacterium]
MGDAPRILLVGGGAVGQAYGFHLQRGGARVAFLLKPRHAAAARAGFAVYPLNTKAGKRREPTRFSGFDVRTDVGEVAAERWDQVWLCLSSTALRAPWFDALCGAIGDATLVSLTPALDDHRYVTARYPAERVVAGMINMISYQAPLPGEVVPEPGVAYYRPGRNPFSGPDAGRVAAVVAALSAGGWKARRVRDAARAASFGSAMMMPALVALELSGWSLAAVRRSPALRTAVAASGEAMRVVAAYRGESRPLSRLAMRPCVLRLVTRLAPRVLPLDVETYLRVHFEKVGDQTAFMLERYATLGAERGVPTPALEALRARLAAARQAK